MPRGRLPLLDLGGLYHLTVEQLDLHGEFERAGLLALLGMGSSPGKTNVMAARAVRELGVTPERVDVWPRAVTSTRRTGRAIPYAPRTLVDELTMAPMASRDGRPEELEPLQDGGDRLPRPHRPRRDHLHPALRGPHLPRELRLHGISFRLSLAPAVLERTRNLTGRRRRDRGAAAVEAVPSSGRTVSIHVVEAEADGRPSAVTAVTKPMLDWGIGGGIVSTAAPSAAAVRLLRGAGSRSAAPAA